jgi:CheY-like chemotaxis protein
MKKVLIADNLKHLFYSQTNGFFNRTQVKIFTVATNDETLKVHREEKVDLIVTRLDLPGVRSEDLFESIRQNKGLREVSTIIICEDTPASRERCGQCGANAVFTLPVDKVSLLAKIQELVEVAPRRYYRVAISVSVEGTLNNVPVLFRMENISANGMLIKADDSLSLGDQISFSFFLPDDTRVRARGKIERVVKQEATPDGGLYGVEFTDLAPSYRFAIEKIVKKEQDRIQALAPLPAAELARFKKIA